ncbi:NAD(P)-binding protein [Mycena venus]|uniref:NAD(P)-binding protein n=1 Tax=Mycena venus TaxID=2733690 RepID=A0A8H6YEL6_9AGAR|nr:NAD(P)-binding protein [Mycena venus]
MSASAIVTGCAANGIGRAIAFRLAKDGLNVAVNDLPSRKEELKQLAKDIEAKYPNIKAIATPADVSDEEGVKGMVAKTVETFGGLDVMLRFVFHILIAFLKLPASLEAFMRIQSVNVGGTFLCYKYAAQAMIEGKKGGRIIGASSFIWKTRYYFSTSCYFMRLPSTFKPGTPFCPGYAASKGAIRSLTQSCAIELAPHNITCNAYAPGVIKTDLARHLNESFKAVMGMSFEELGNAMAPMHRCGEPDEIANFVSWLASKESSYMTGQTVSINGGIFFD